MFILQNVALILIGLVGLYFGGDWLVDGASRIAKRFDISPLIIGLTIVAIGTSAPELVVSVVAALNGTPGIALGNVIGSNIANIGLILGLTGVIHAITVKESLIRREIPILIIVTIFASIIILDGTISRLDGILLLFGFIAYNLLFYYLATHEHDEEDDLPEAEPGTFSLLKQIFFIVAGSALLVVGADVLVRGATEIARSMGISDLVIGVTAIAFGTSLPELVTSLNAALSKKPEIAVGNVVGSNIANLLLVLGGTSTIAQINVGDTSLSLVEYVVMLAFTFMLYPFARNRELSRIESALFLGAYVAFIAYSFFLSGEAPPAV